MRAGAPSASARPSTTACAAGRPATVVSARSTTTRPRTPMNRWRASTSGVRAPGARPHSAFTSTAAGAARCRSTRSASLASSTTQAPPGKATRYPLGEWNAPPSKRRPAQPPSAATTSTPSAAARPSARRRLTVGRAAPRLAPRELLEHLAERDPALPQEHQRVEPEVGDLLDDAPVALAAERRGDHLRGLLADLAADRRPPRREQPGDVRAGGRGRLARRGRALQTLEHVGRRRAGRLAAVERRGEA